MRHWTERMHHAEGLSEAAAPPIPRHHAANDIGARLARVEEHLQFSHHSRVRLEMESKERDRDLAAAIVSMRTMFETTMAPIRDMMAVRAYRKEMRMIFGSWALWSVKLALGLLLVLGTITGRLTPEQAKVIGGWLGLPN